MMPSSTSSRRLIKEWVLQDDTTPLIDVPGLGLREQGASTTGFSLRSDLRDCDLGDPIHSRERETVALREVSRGEIANGDVR
jgi:hypothetical protein